MKKTKIKWDAVLELLVLIISLVFIIITFIMMLSGKVRIGYIQFGLFFLAIGMSSLMIESLTDRFNNSKE